MELYTIFGVNVVERLGHSYETDSCGRIFLDAEGKGMTKPRKFNDYILYAYSGEVYYSIHLKESEGASFGGHLYTMAHMKIEVSPYPTIADLTHYPIKPLRVYADFEARDFDFYEEVDVCLHDDPYTRLFCYSGLGSGDECVPEGYVIVNMDLFWERDNASFMSKI